MNQDAIEDEIRKPPGLGEKLIQLGLQTGDGPLRKAAALEGVHVIGTMRILDQLLEGQYIDLETYENCIVSLLKYNGEKVRLPENKLRKRFNKNLV